jgi:regulatory protein
MKKEVTETEVLKKMANLCSLKEYCIEDIRKKIAETGLTEEENKRIIDRLCAEKFIDDTRFVRAFTKDKLLFGKWGRIKIKYALLKKGISADLIESELQHIDEAEYRNRLEDLLRSKIKTLKGDNSQEIFSKLYRFASSRGFEHGLILSFIKKLPHTDCDEYDLE